MIKINRKLDHKKIWLDSMVGMTWGFIATLVVGTIVGLIALIPGLKFLNVLKLALTYMTPFGIGIGVGIKANVKPMHIFAIGIAAFLVGQSLFAPQLKNGVFNFHPQIGVAVPFTKTGIMIPKAGDVFGAWLVGVLALYLFSIFEIETMFDILLLPIIGMLIGLATMFWFTYLTSTVTCGFEWLIENTINRNRTASILLAPVLGILIGLALSFPTSSVGMVIALKIGGTAGIAAMAGTAAQMISFGALTFMATKKWAPSISVGFASSMLQMRNFMRRPILLLIPAIASAVSAMLAVAVLGTETDVLGFVNKGTNPTAGMGTCALYGPIFTLKDSGADHWQTWLHVIGFQFVVPLLVTLPLGYLFINKKQWIKPQWLEI